MHLMDLTVTKKTIFGVVLDFIQAVEPNEITYIFSKYQFFVHVHIFEISPIVPKYMYALRYYWWNLDILVVIIFILLLIPNEAPGQWTQYILNNIQLRESRLDKSHITYNFSWMSRNKSALRILEFNEFHNHVADNSVSKLQLHVNPLLQTQRGASPSSRRPLRE